MPTIYFLACFLSLFLGFGVMLIAPIWGLVLIGVGLILAVFSAPMGKYLNRNLSEETD